MKLSSTNGLAVQDYFTPQDQASLAAGDTDLGSGGAVACYQIRWGSASHPHLMTGAGKEGTIYLLDRDNMGHYNDNNDKQNVQKLQSVIVEVWSSGAYWNHLRYYQGSGDVMRAFAITNGVFNTSQVMQSGDEFWIPRSDHR